MSEFKLPIINIRDAAARALAKMQEPEYCAESHRRLPKQMGVPLGYGLNLVMRLDEGYVNSRPVFLHANCVSDRLSGVSSPAIVSNPGSIPDRIFYMLREQKAFPDFETMAASIQSLEPIDLYGPNLYLDRQLAKAAFPNAVNSLDELAQGRDLFVWYDGLRRDKFAKFFECKDFFKRYLTDMNQ